MRAGIETKAAKAGALRGRAGRKRRDRAGKKPRRIRSERRSPESRTVLASLPFGATRCVTPSGAGEGATPPSTPIRKDGKGAT